jgi:hypothetical protein
MQEYLRVWGLGFDAREPKSVVEDGFVLFEAIHLLLQRLDTRALPLCNLLNRGLVQPARTAFGFVL